MTHQVYISYSSWDKLIADAVCQHLEQNGLSCWIAPRDIGPSPDMASSVIGAIGDCRILVLILSSRANSSHHIMREVQLATERHKHIIAFRIEDVSLGSGLEFIISSIVWVDALTPPLEKHLNKATDIINNTLLYPDYIRPHTTGTEVDTSASCGPGHAQKEEQQGRTKYDVFISYRRATDSQTARLIRSEIQRRGFRVFLDVDDLRPGHFDEALLERIEEARSFILILSNGSLDNCANSDDWLRREIICALTKRKNIIPIMMPGFGFPTTKDLPLELQPLPVHHGINYSHDFFDAMMEKIVDYLGIPEGG